MPSPLALTLIYHLQSHTSNNAFSILEFQQCLHHLLRPRLRHIPTHNVHRMAYLIAISSWNMSLHELQDMFRDWDHCHAFDSTSELCLVILE